MMPGGSMNPKVNGTDPATEAGFMSTALGVRAPSKFSSLLPVRRVEQDSG